MRSKVLLAAGIMVFLISMITGTLVVMLRVVNVSTRPDAHAASWSRIGWLSLLGLALGLTMAIQGARRKPQPAK